MPLEQLESLREILQDFEKYNIQYCLLRNYEFLLDSSLPLESLDTVLDKNSLPKAHELFLKHGFMLRKPQFSLTHKAYFKIVNLQKISFDIQIGGVHWNDMQYIDEFIIRNRVKKEFFYVPSDNDTFVMLLVHSILGKRYFKPKYQGILATIPIDERYVTERMTKLFNQQKAIQLVKSARQRQLEPVSPFPFIIHFLFKKPSRILTLSALTLRWIKWKKPFLPAPLISIVGPDGAGKTTMVKNLHDSLLQTKRKSVIIYTGRGRNQVLPFGAIGRKYKAIEKKKDAQYLTKVPSHSRKLLYTLSSFVFAFDLLLRYYFTILPQRLRKRIVITDRYCSDIILMKHVPFPLKKLLYQLFPEPTISILLYNYPEVLHQRRPEEPITELQRQMELFNKLHYSLRVETTNPEEDEKKVLEFVVKKLLVNWY